MKNKISSQLLDWYAVHQRDLPWRRTRDPFAIWVAEVMLQQTQVTTVIPYYERFLAHFPDLETLAAAPLDQVLKLWEGLGYYARARNLYAAARRVVAEFDAQLPMERKALLSLPGIGDYTAGALLSIVGGQDVPALDGNARRVFSRLYAIQEDMTRSAGKKVLKAHIASVLPPGQAGQFNQALMDLGAEICTPRNPACHTCPLSAICQAHQKGQPETFPVRRPRPRVPHYQVSAGVVWNGRQKFLVAQRPLDGMLGGLWEFPGGKREDNETWQDCLHRELKEELDIEVNIGPLLTIVKHAYTHFRITLHAFCCQLVNGPPRALECNNWQWITIADIDRFAFSTADHKIIAALRTTKTNGPVLC